MEIGILTADPGRTQARFPGVKCFDVSRGRLRAVFAAVRWCHIAIVGGGELVQDDSSLLYSPFNLLPLFLAFLMGKKSFAWAVGIGQGGELTLVTRLLTRLALKTAAGMTVRDRGSFNTLHQMGFREPEMRLAADCAFALPVLSGEKEAVLGAAPRDVSNRKRHLLPLELRRKLGIHKPPNPSSAASAWAKLLDWHAGRTDSRVILFPFHTGPLSNDDHVFCKLVAGRMKHAERVSFADPSNPEEFLELLGKCPVMVTTPLHGAILSVMTGTLPVSVSYSSKCLRFMEQADLMEFAAPPGRPGIPDNGTVAALRLAWGSHASRRPILEERRRELRSRAELTAEHFRRVCGL